MMRDDDIEPVTDGEVLAAIYAVPTHFADLVITATSVVLVSGQTQIVKLGANLTAGQGVYVSDSTTNPPTVLAAKNDTSAHATLAGVLLSGGNSGQIAAMATLGCTVTIGATVTQGAVYVVSANAGGIAPDSDLTTGNYVTDVGRAISSANIKLTGTAYGITHA